MKNRLPLILLIVGLIGLSVLNLSFYPSQAPVPDDVQSVLQSAIGKRVELILIECDIKPRSRYIINKIEDGFCLFTCEDSTRSSILQAINLPIERILTVRQLSKDTFALIAL